jgi:hypothetical protein
VVPVNTAVTPPTVGTAISVPGMVPGQLAACRGSIYVADQYSGRVVRLANGAVTASLDACAVGAGGFAYASDVECGP